MGGFGGTPTEHLVSLPMSLLTCSADVAGGVRGPGEAVDRRPVVAQSGHGNTGNTDIQYYHLRGCEGGGGGRREREREGGLLRA